MVIQQPMVIEDEGRTKPYVLVPVVCVCVQPIHLKRVTLVS